MEIKGLAFVKTCIACPEQYNVFDSNRKQVGYIRLRWGHLTCEYPDVCGDLIYDYDFYDEWKGCFDNDEEMEFHLNAIADAILERIDQDKKNQNILYLR